MKPVPPPTKMEKWIERSDIPLLILAFFAVLIYMAELVDLWKHLGIENAYKKVSFLIDLIFFADLITKIIVLKRPYLSGPWFVVDLIAALPLLFSLGLPAELQGLRFIRGVRLFRALRSLRMLRAIPIIRFEFPNRPLTIESTRFNRMMWVIVPSYAVVFAIFVSLIYDYTGESTGKIVEFYLLLGSLLGMGLVILVVRFLLPAIMSVQIYGLLNVALPVQVAEYFSKHPEGYSHTVRMPATILFSDIKGFTASVEKIGDDLNALKSHLEQVIDAIAEVHQKYDLIIDKFIGDAIMSFRGGDLVTGNAEEHAWRVVRAAIEGRKAIQAINDPYFTDIKVGGASSPSVLIGAFGTSTRLSYTVLGDRVNLAARLEGAVKQCGTTNLFCDLTYELLKKRKDLVWRRFGKLRVEGKKEALDVYEVFDVYDVPNPNWIILYHYALADFERGNFIRAQEKFLQVDNIRIGGDIPSMNYFNLCQKLINNAVPPHWFPVFITNK